MWLAWRLFGPEIEPRFAPGQTHPLRLPGRSLFVGDNEIFVRETGPEDGPVLVLVHGWGDHSLVIYSKLIPLLATRFRVVALDNRNSGRSAEIRARYEIADAADDVAGVLEQLGLARVAVFGYSMGGMIVQELARRHPHLVGRMGLGGTAASVGRLRDLPRPAVAAAMAVARAFERITRHEISSVRTRYLMKVGAVAPEHGRYFWTQHMARDPELYWQAGSAISRFDARAWSGALDRAPLVIITTHDQLMPPDSQYELASLFEAADVVELAGARHEAPLTHASAMAEAITRWAAPDHGG